MMRFTFSLSAFLLGFQWLVAQEITYIDLTKEVAIVSNFPYRIEKVIDASTEKGSIGFVLPAYTPLMKRLVPTATYFKQNTEDELLAYFHKNVKPQPNAPAMWVKVNKVGVMSFPYKINKFPGVYPGLVNYYEELDMAIVSLTFLKKTNDTLFEELYTCSHILHLKDITPNINHAQNLSTCLNFCLREFAQKSEKRQLSSLSRSYADVTKPTVETTDFACMKGVKGKKALFHTYGDFLQQIKDTSTTFEVNYFLTDNEQNRYATLAGNPKVWGFFDGKKTYVRIYENKFHPLVFEKAAYHVWLAQPSKSFLKEKNRKKYPWLTDMTTVPYFTVFYADYAIGHYTSQNFSKKIRFNLDVATGYFGADLQPIDYAATVNVAKVIVYSSLMNRTSDAFKLQFSGKDAVVLPAASYYEWTDNGENKRTTLSVTYGDVTKTFTYEPDMLNTHILKCYVSNKGGLDVEWVKNSEERAKILGYIKQKRLKQVL